MQIISLVPRPSRPSICPLQYLRGGSPGKTESRGMTYLDIWRSGSTLVLQATNAGVKMPWYEASKLLHIALLCVHIITTHT